MSEQNQKELRRSLRVRSNLQTKDTVTSKLSPSPKSDRKQKTSKNTGKENIESELAIHKKTKNLTNASIGTLTPSSSNASVILLDSDSAEDKNEISKEKVIKLKKPITKGMSVNSSKIDFEQTSAGNVKETKSKADVFPDGRASKRKIVELDIGDEASSDTDAKSRKFQKFITPNCSLTRKSTVQNSLQSEVSTMNISIESNSNLDIMEINISEDSSNNSLLEKSRLSSAKVAVNNTSEIFFTNKIQSIKNKFQGKSKTASDNSTAATSCGLCGCTTNLIKTQCCDAYVCDDLSKFKMFDKLSESCFRNHKRFF
jgi:hypothetical protein